MYIKYICSIFLLAILNGCAVGPTFITQVDSIAAPDTTNKTTYILFPGNKNTSPNDLRYIEFKNYVNKALQAKGFKETNLDDADIAIFLTYGISDPNTEQYTYSVPTWGQTGVSSSTTYGTLNTFGNNATYSGTTTYTPSYGITGSTTHLGTRTTYFRYLDIGAYDLDEYRKTEQLKQVWKTTTTSTGSSGDLRQVLPVLVAASSQYLGTNTGKKLSIELKENDESVKAIKGLQEPETNQ